MTSVYRGKSSTLGIKKHSRTKQFIAILIGACGGLILALPGKSFAETADTCAEVLQTSARNYSQSGASSAIAYKVYNQYCQQDHARSGQSTAIGLDAILDEMPARFSLNNASTSDRLNNFCKTFDSDYQQQQSWYQNLSLANDNTTAAWLQCKLLATKGVGFSTMVSQQQMLISVRRMAGDDVTVSGVNYDQRRSAMTCTVPNSDNINHTVVADGNTTKRLGPDFWTITCMRNGINSGNSTIYPPATISVITSAGPFLFTADGDQAFDLQYASTINSKLTDLQSTVAAIPKSYKIKITQQGSRFGENNANYMCANDVPDTVVIGIGQRDGSHGNWTYCGIVTVEPATNSH